jgi:hypothetical protein
MGEEVVIFLGYGPQVLTPKYTRVRRTADRRIVIPMAVIKLCAMVTRILGLQKQSAEGEIPVR